MDDAGPEAYSVVVGIAVGAHGLHGEVRVLPQTDFPERLAQRGELWVEQGGQGRLCRVEGGRLQAGKGLVLLRLEGCRDRTAAEALRGAVLKIRPADVVPLGPGEYYEWQIVGLEVVTGSGEAVGRVTQILHTGANDVYVVGERLIPAIPEVIQSVDLPAGRIVIEPMPGLLD